jgi:PAS domain S-box-containing protein
MSPASAARATILLVDDTPLNLILLGNALEEDYDLRIATSGEEALRIAPGLQPDLVLLDIMMPGIDGLETCRQMKARPELVHTPVIFVTALGEQEFEATGLDYLTKPINVELARQRIRNLLDRENLRKQVEAHRDQLEQLVAERTVQLRASEAMYRGLVEQSVVGVYKFKDGRFTYLNPGLVRMLGYDSLKSLIEQASLENTIAPEDRARIAQWIEDGSGQRSLSFNVLHRDGTQRVLETHERVIEEGEERTLLGIAIDITERRRSEQAQAAALAAAEHLAALKSEFVNNVSHELRTPLNAVLGFAEVGLGTQDISRAHRFFRLIRESGMQLLDITGGMLDFSAAEEGELLIEPAPFDPVDVLGAVAGRFRLLAEAKGLVFTCAGLPGESMPRLGDGKRLAQLVGLLLDNAIKFTPKGDVSLALDFSAGSLGITIADTGIGMTPEQVTRAFDAFHQADGSRTRQFGGLGLGLALAKYLVDQMRGEIRVDSAPGEGTRFSIVLPMPSA